MGQQTFVRRMSRRSFVCVTVAAGLSAMSLTACGSDSASESGGEGFDEADIEAALQEETTLTVWSFSAEMTQIAEAFEKKYPAVTVEVTNPSDIYTSLQNAIDAGSGAPDIVTIEYFALPQFALTGALADLSEFGLDGLGELYSPSVWSAVNVGEQLVALPRGDGPMALFYNKTVFDQHGIAVPETWEQYVAAARTIHESDPTAYITSDVGDPSLITGLIWQAGGRPFGIEGETEVSVNLQDEGSQEFAGTWNELLTNDLLAPIASWTDEWYRALADGKIASLISGAWMAGSLPSSVPAGEGQWRVARLPAFEDGSVENGVWGGGGEAIVEQSENKLAAAGFLKFVSAGEGAQISLDLGFFPSTVAELESTEFLDAAPEYFGGQQVNRILAEAANDVAEGWEYLPYQLYANSVFADTVGQSYATKSDLNEGLRAWQERMVTYGEDQGFTVNDG